MPSDQVSAELNPFTELVPPPSRPLRCSDESNWDTLKATIDFPFPDEFREYGKLYGTGEIDANGYGLCVANPLDPAYPKWLTKNASIMSTIGDPPGLRPTRFYPEENGMVPFAMDLSGDLLFLSMRKGGVRVISSPLGAPDEEIVYAHDFVSFLVALFKGELKPEYFPNEEMKKRTPEFIKRAWLK